MFLKFEKVSVAHLGKHQSLAISVAFRWRSHIRFFLGTSRLMNEHRELRYRSEKFHEISDVDARFYCADKVRTALWFAML
jgi:hypothetical protein